MSRHWQQKNCWPDTASRRRFRDQLNQSSLSTRNGLCLVRRVRRMPGSISFRTSVARHRDSLMGAARKASGMAVGHAENIMKSCGIRGILRVMQSASAIDPNGRGDVAETSQSMAKASMA